MKKDIHPKYYPKAEVICSCGHKFYVGSTKPKMEVEICSHCHPFFTGRGKLIDTAGRVKKFEARLEKSKTFKTKTKTKTKTKASRTKTTKH